MTDEEIIRGLRWSINAAGEPTVMYLDNAKIKVDIIDTAEFPEHLIERVQRLMVMHVKEYYGDDA